MTVLIIYICTAFGCTTLEHELPPDYTTMTCTIVAQQVAASITLPGSVIARYSCKVGRMI